MAKSFTSAGSAAAFSTLLLVFSMSLYADPQSSVRCSVTLDSSSEGRSFDAGTFQCVAGNEGCDGGQLLTLEVAARSVRAVLVSNLQRAETAATPLSSCTRSDVGGHIQWISSASWVERKKEFLVVDSISKQLLAVSAKGDVKQDVNTAARVSRESFAPVYIVPVRDNYLLVMVGSEAVLFDPVQNSRVSNGNVQELTDWATVGDEIVGYGTPNKDKANLGFISTKVAEKPLHVQDTKLLLPFPQERYYRLGFHYVAANEDTVYWVAMSDRAEIYRYSPKDGRTEKLSVFPDRYRTVPPLKTRLTGPKDMESLYEEIESATLPVGLYSQGKWIYLLTREPSGRSEHGTIWRLHKIDPIERKILGSVKLPTRANHLTVVPTPRAWYLFEKGPVGKLGRQNVSSLIEIPTALIEDTKKSPLNDTTHEALVCRTNTSKILRGLGADSMASLKQNSGGL